MLCRDGEATVDDVAIEIESFKLANKDRHDPDIVAAAVPILMDSVDRNVKSGKELMSNVRTVPEVWPRF